eukprot:1160401-Pelagomonas_calceolata.AAC.10
MSTTSRSRSCCTTRGWHTAVRRRPTGRSGETAVQRKQGPSGRCLARPARRRRRPASGWALHVCDCRGGGGGRAPCQRPGRRQQVGRQLPCAFAVGHAHAGRGTCCGAVTATASPVAGGAREVGGAAAESLGTCREGGGERGGAVAGDGEALLEAGQQLVLVWDLHVGACGCARAARCLLVRECESVVGELSALRGTEAAPATESCLLVLLFAQKGGAGIHDA